jgi:hypothetical protein
MKEFNSVYARADARLDGSAFALADGEFQYNYTATWLSGGAIPLVQIGVLGAPIENPQVPLGWEVVGFPFAQPQDILSFRVAPTDQVQAYLGSENPVLAFSFVSPEPPTMTFGWAGSDQPVQSVVGPSAVPVPEPSVLTLGLTGALVLILAAWRHQKKAAA